LGFASQLAVASPGPSLIANESARRSSIVWQGMFPVLSRRSPLMYFTRRTLDLGDCGWPEWQLPLALANAWGCVRRRPAATPPLPRRHSRRHPPVLAIAWGVYHDARSPPTRYTPRARNCMGGLPRCSATTHPPPTPLALAIAWGAYITMFGDRSTPHSQRPPPCESESARATSRSISLLA
jgi:hypothetical protein